MKFQFVYVSKCCKYVKYQIVGNDVYICQSGHNPSYVLVKIETVIRQNGILKEINGSEVVEFDEISFSLKKVLGENVEISPAEKFENIEKLRSLVSIPNNSSSEKITRLVTFKTP